VAHVATANAFARAGWDIHFIDTDTHGILNYSKIPRGVTYQAVVLVGLYGHSLTNYGDFRNWTEWKHKDVVINEDSSLYYKVIDVQKPYKYNLRLKPFITSFGRIQTAKIALENLDSVIRIHTDGIVFDKPITTDLPNFIPEKKTTGRIQWNNVNDYHRI
jgi:hypothetical protein